MKPEKKPIRHRLMLTLTEKQNAKLKKIQRSMNALSRQETLRHLIELDREVA